MLLGPGKYCFGCRRLPKSERTEFLAAIQEVIISNIQPWINWSIHTSRLKLPNLIKVADRMKAKLVLIVYHNSAKSSHNPNLANQFNPPFRPKVRSSTTPAISTLNDAICSLPYPLPRITTPTGSVPSCWSRREEDFGPITARLTRLAATCTAHGSCVRWRAVFYFCCPTADGARSNLGAISCIEPPGRLATVKFNDGKKRRRCET